MSPEVAILLMFVSLVVGVVVLGGHLGFVLSFITIVFGLLTWGPSCFNAIIYRAWGIMTNYILIAIPMFVFMGCVLERAGFAEDLYAGIEALMGRMRGGLAIGSVLLSTALAMCTGIVASSVTMGGVLGLPPMLKRGYDKRLAMGAIAAGGTLGILIPPSILLVIYGSLAQLSVGHLFLGAFLPGFLLSGLFMSYIAIISFLRPQMAPAAPSVGVMSGDSRTKFLRGIRGILPMGVLILAVLGTIVFGIATPTEASGTGAFVAVLIAAAYRRANRKTLKEAAVRTLELMGMQGGVVIGAMGFSTIFLTLGGVRILSDLLLGADLPPLAVLLIMMLIPFFLGMFVEYWSILLICLPVFLPIVEIMGWDPIWFGLLMCVNLQMAWLTPPFGYSLFYLRAIAPPQITFADIILGCAPFVVLQATGLGLCIAFPQIITFLPKLVFK